MKKLVVLLVAGALVLLALVILAGNRSDGAQHREGTPSSTQLSPKELPPARRGAPPTSTTTSADSPPEGLDAPQLNKQQDESLRRMATAGADAMAMKLAERVEMSTATAEAVAALLREERDGALRIMAEATSAERERALEKHRAEYRERVLGLLDERQAAAYLELRPR